MLHFPSFLPCRRRLLEKISTEFIDEGAALGLKFFFDTAETGKQPALADPFAGAMLLQIDRAGCQCVSDAKEHAVDHVTHIGKGVVARLGNAGLVGIKTRKDMSVPRLHAVAELGDIGLTCFEDALGFGRHSGKHRQSERDRGDDGKKLRAHCKHKLIPPTGGQGLTTT